MKNLNWTRTWLLCSLFVGGTVFFQTTDSRTVSFAADAAATGTFTGQVTLDGAIPKLAPATTDKDPKAADLKACNVSEVPNEKLVVDPESKGLANVFVYLKKAPANTPANLKKSEEATVTFDNKGCQFVPHALIVRNDQTVLVTSQDPVGHNTHTYPVRNTPFNGAIKAMEMKGVEIKNKAAENLPVTVKCDIHPWMTAYWLVVDHPYAAVTDKEGKFKIENLPAGDYKFVVWHEGFGYVVRELAVKVESDKVATKEIKADVKKFKS